jgi:hypothetical protein
MSASSRTRPPAPIDPSGDRCTPPEAGDRDLRLDGELEPLEAEQHRRYVATQQSLPTADGVDRSESWWSLGPLRARRMDNRCYLLASANRRYQ